MTLDDLKKIFMGPTLFRLDTILSPRLVPLLYGTGLAALLLWAVTHLFATFGHNFGDGLWGLLEIVVFGLLGLIALRVVCELLLVFFKANETVTRTVALTRIPRPLAEEVADAIHDIAEEEGAGHREEENPLDEDDPLSTTPRPKRTPPSSPDL